MSETMRKTAISRPEELGDCVDDRPDARHTSRSQVLCLALAAIKSHTEGRLAADSIQRMSSI